MLLHRLSDGSSVGRPKMLQVAGNIETMPHQQAPMVVIDEPAMQNQHPIPSNQSIGDIKYPDFDQWIQTAGNIGYVTSVMLARSKSESTLSEFSEATTTRPVEFFLFNF